MVGVDGRAVDQRTTLTAGTAVAFADGAFAVGRPIGNGFAIVEPHTSLDGSTITIGAQSRNGAASDFLGPALVSDLSPYSAAHLPIDVADLPVGYDLGAGAFDVFAHYKTGYRLTVGSDYTVSAIGTLVDEEGEPIALLTGDAWEEGQPEGRHVEIFTNRAGRFGAQGLKPGRWLVDMATDPKTRFVIEVPEGTNGMLRLGTLEPAKREQ
jgi:outer membrane usher protein